MPCMHCGRPVLKYVFHRCEIPMPAESSKEAMAAIRALMDEACPHVGVRKDECNKCLALALDAWRDKALEEAARLCEKRGAAQARMEAWHIEHHQDGGDADLHHGDSVGARALAAAIRSLRSAREEEGKGEAQRV